MRALSLGRHLPSPRPVSARAALVEARIADGLLHFFKFFFLQFSWPRVSANERKSTKLRRNHVVGCRFPPHPPSSLRSDAITPKPEAKAEERGNYLPTPFQRSPVGDFFRCRNKFTLSHRRGEGRGEGRTCHYTLTAKTRPTGRSTCLNGPSASQVVRESLAATAEAASRALVCSPPTWPPCAAVEG